MNTYTQGQRVRVKDDVWDHAGREGTYNRARSGGWEHSVKLDGKECALNYYDNEIEAIEEQEA